MYLTLILNAIFRPWVVSRRIACRHPNEKSHLIDAGRLEGVTWDV